MGEHVTLLHLVSESRDDILGYCDDGFASANDGDLAVTECGTQYTVARAEFLISRDAMELLSETLPYKPVEITGIFCKKWRKGEKENA